MTKKCFRPFWSFDVQETEKWLAQMAGQGWRLSRVNFRTRAFLFEQCEPHRVVYRIQYLRVFDGSLSQGMAVSGWSIASSNHHWCIFCNANDPSQIRNYPQRDDIIRHNSIYMYLSLIYIILYGFFLICFLEILPVLFLFGMILSAFEDLYSIMASEFPWITYQWLGVVLLGLLIISTILLFIEIFALVEISSSNKRLKKQMNRLGSMSPRIKHSIPLSQGLKSGLIVHRIKFFWQLAPDKAEKWLESMAQKGLLFHSLSGYTFYFLKSHPVTMRFCLDYQKSVTSDYYNLHINIGWSLRYTTQSPFQNRWTIWAKQYVAGTDIPELHTDKKESLRNIKTYAWKTASAYFVGFVYFTAFLGFQIGQIITRAMESRQLTVGLGEYNATNTILDVIYALMIVALVVISSVITIPYLCCAIQPLRYYFRMKKKYDAGK